MKPKKKKITFISWKKEKNYGYEEVWTPSYSSKEI